MPFSSVSRGNELFCFLVYGLFAFEIANFRDPSFRSTKLEKDKYSTIIIALAKAKIKAENMAKV
ncbi:MAG TPA: hypothetical protein DHU89_01570 [Flavobacteriales bacterium]|nr:hypothetical protein [Flavobacteriales bacterium]